MNKPGHWLFLLGIVIISGCYSEQVSDRLNPSSSPTTQQAKFTDRLVEASCGQCQFGMEGKGCELAVRIDGKSYFVTGSLIDDHGDAHADNGLCNSIRKANVSGSIKDGRFVAEKFELID